MTSSKLLSIDIILFSYMLSLFFEYMLIQNTIFVKVCAKEQNIQNSDQLLNDFCDRSTLNDTIKLRINDELTEIIHNYNLILFIIPMITTFLIGSWSDLFGRKLPILLNLAGSSIVQMIMITFSRQQEFQHFKYVIYGCALISGLTGSAATMISSCYAYVSDVTTTKNLTHRLAILQTFAISGSFVGSNLVALLISKVSISNQFQLGFSFLLLLHLCNIFISCIYIKVPKDRTDDNTPSLKNLVSKQHFLYNLAMIYKDGKLNTKLILFNLCAIASFYCLAIQQISLFAYLKRPPFAISSSLYGYFQAGFFLLKGVSLILLFPRLNKWLRSVFMNRLTSKLEQNKELKEPNEPHKELNQLLNLDVLYQKTDILLCIMAFVSKFAGLLAIGLITDLKQIPLIPLMFALNENFCFFTGSIGFKKLFALTRDINYGLTFDLVAIFQIFSIVILIFIYRTYKISSSLQS